MKQDGLALRYEAFFQKSENVDSLSIFQPYAIL